MPQGRFASLPFDRPQQFIEQLVYYVEKAIVGKRESIEMAAIAFLSGGHILLEDVPGVGKTLLVRAFAKTLGASFKRIQCTPDLLPSDVTGVSVYNPKTGQFEYRPGPVMAHIVLADEMNRASPRTQSALLEAMEEKQVTVDGETHPLPQPFLLMATQNPAEHEGTFPLPEAQLDRFMLKIRLGYPDLKHEVEMLGRVQERQPLDEVRAVLVPEEWTSLMEQVRSVLVDESLKTYIVQLTSATRCHRDIELGASPRASVALLKAAQAKAFLSGRGYAVPDDIKKMAVPVLAHRLVLRPEAKYAGKTAEAAVKEILAATAVPALRGAAGGSA